MFKELTIAHKGLRMQFVQGTHIHSRCLYVFYTVIAEEMIAGELDQVVTCSERI